MKKKNYILNLLLILVITLVVLWFALKDNYKEIVGAITNMNPFYMAIILIWGALFTAVWGGVYWVLGKKFKPDYTLLNGIVVAFTGAFFAGVTPSSTGGQFGQAYILKKQGIGYSDGASILWTDFIVYQTTMMIYVTILFVWKFGEFAGHNSWLYLCLAGYVVNLIVIIGLYTMAIFPKFYVWLFGKAGKLLDKMHFLKNPEETLARWESQVKNFTSQIGSLSKDWKRLVICMGINFVRLTLLYSLPLPIALALGAKIQHGWLWEVIALSSFVTMANSFIPIPGASGGTEIMFSSLFYRLFGTMTSAVMLLWRASSYYIVILLGALIFWIASSYYSRKSKNKNREGIS